VVEALIRVATVNQQLAHLDEAERALEQALEISENALGHRHPDLVPLLEFLATINREQGELDNAATLIARVLSIETAIYGEHSDIVVTTAGELRDIYEELGQSQDSRGR
jgi:tetratricopeptide (TPR) repeat protein